MHENDIFVRRFHEHFEFLLRRHHIHDIVVLKTFLLIFEVCTSRDTHWVLWQIESALCYIWTYIVIKEKAVTKARVGHCRMNWCSHTGPSIIYKDATDSLHPSASLFLFPVRQVFHSFLLIVQGPHSHMLMTGRSEWFFGPEILAKVSFFGSMKDAGIFLGREEKQRGFLGCKKGQRDFFLGMLKK